jgi:hypothetical protein
MQRLITSREDGTCTYLTFDSNLPTHQLDVLF